MVIQSRLTIMAVWQWCQPSASHMEKLSSLQKGFLLHIKKNICGTQLEEKKREQNYICISVRMKKKCRYSCCSCCYKYFLVSLVTVDHCTFVIIVFLCSLYYNTLHSSELINFRSTYVVHLKNTFSTDIIWFI